MADDTDTDDEAAPSLDRRRSPLVKHVPIWIGFLVLVVIGVLTVLIPEITDEGDEEEDGTAAEIEGSTEPETTASP